MSDRLSPERAVRLLRAKGAELEKTTRVFYDAGGMATNEMIGNLAADIALVAQLLADAIERSESEFHIHTKTGKVLTNEDLQALADEAEAGYDVSHLRERDG
jgi:hypothetical protein